MMFDFFDPAKNPFMAMLSMNEEAAEDSGKGAPGGFAPFFGGADAGGDGAMDPMRFMQQAFMMQMQIAQTMFMMPLQMMKSMAGMAGLKGMADMAGMAGLKPGAGEGGSQAQQQGGFKMGDMEIPPELLSMLLNMDMSPENLEKLQKALDFIFSMMPDKKEGGDEKQA